MAYITGVAASAADLVTAIRNACIANGWVLTNDILSKGTCFVRLWSPSAGYVSVTAGRGQTGGAGSTLTGQSNASIVGIGGTLASNAFTFPLTYHIHLFTAPEEVYVIVNYSSVLYQRLMFGQIQTPGLVGTGTYYDATRESSAAAHIGNLDNRISGRQSTHYRPYPWGNYPGYVGGDSGFDHSMTSDPQWNSCDMNSASWPALSRTPNLWNGEAVLIPAQLYVPNPSQLTLVAEFTNMRMVFIDNLDPEQILTLGAEQWRVYPCFKKNSSRTGLNSSGTFPDSCVYGIALRYDGP